MVAVPIKKTKETEIAQLTTRVEHLRLNKEFKLCGASDAAGFKTSTVFQRSPRDGRERVMAILRSHFQLENYGKLLMNMGKEQ